MASVPLGVYSEDREEGEIVDDDFEDISDNSIIVPNISGKSVSAKEHLPAISLSSVTEVDEPKNEIKTRHRHRVSRKKSVKKKRRNSHRKSTCSDSDSDEYLALDKKLQKQLKAAIRVDDTEERHQNSLRTRLKGMTKLDESDSGVERNDEKAGHKDSTDEGDSELAQLRLEALRTAVLNKFMHRKKRKVKETNDTDVLSDISIKTENSETNKENNLNTTENCPKKLCVENSVQTVENKVEIMSNVEENNTAPEDDEDVLRALLLASMSKKITSESQKKQTIIPLKNNLGTKHTLQVVNEKKETTKLVVNCVKGLKNRLINNNVSNNLQLPKVKPLIIKVNEDSDSDDDLFNKPGNNQVVAVKPIDKGIESSVEKFLKEQRAKVEAQLSPIQKCPVKPKNSPGMLEKSSVKLLPKVKQIEYQKLLQRLKNAERKPRTRRSSHKFNGEGKPIVNTSKKITRAKLPVPKQAIVFSKVDHKQPNSVTKVEGSVAGVKSEVRTLHKILKEIQVQKNGRLQIQEKYQDLMPVIKQINEASVEKRKWEDEIKRLLQQVAESKKKLAKSQQEFTTHLNNLVQKKEQIEKSTDLKKSEMLEEKKTHFTSTPVKETPPKLSFESSSNNTLPLTERVAEQVADDQMEEDEAPLNPGDPNDIDKIYKKQKNTFLKYISPLDNVKRVVTDDPFSIICPYDVDGNCRDPECIYKHLFK